MKKIILIIGKTPPPIGGVTIHTARLMNWLEKDNIPFHFLNLNFKNLLSIPFALKNYSCIHVHSSNPWVRLYFMILSRLFGKYGIVTIHGDLYRFKSKLKNWLDKKSIQLADKPIVLNERSFVLAKKLKAHTEMISSFIPPDISREHLSLTCIRHIHKMHEKYDILFCTNAFNLSYDKNGNEIYGITELINFFRIHTQFGLIFSDPSSAYKNAFKERNFEIPENVYIINGNHSFYKVMELCDASIRNTTTDGDSISVKESLYLDKITFSTDVVSRPRGCITYKKGNLNDILRFVNQKNTRNKELVENGYIRLKEIYSSHIDN